MTLGAINHLHLGQVFVQAYYALKNYPVLESLVVALTDSCVYHFFKVKLSNVSEERICPLVKVVWATNHTDRAGTDYV